MLVKDCPSYNADIVPLMYEVTFLLPLVWTRKKCHCNIGWLSGDLWYCFTIYQKECCHWGSFTIARTADGSKEDFLIIWWNSWLSICCSKVDLNCLMCQNWRTAVQSYVVCQMWSICCIGCVLLFGKDSKKYITIHAVWVWFFCESSGFWLNLPLYDIFGMFGWDWLLVALQLVMDIFYVFVQWFDMGWLLFLTKTYSIGILVITWK